jgi:hypothetical protein
MKNPIPNDPFRDPDLGLAAFLLTQQDVQFLGLQPKDHRSFFFTFSPYDRCRELADQYFLGRGMVPLGSIGMHYDNVKILCFSDSGNR